MNRTTLSWPPKSEHLIGGGIIFLITAISNAGGVSGGGSIAPFAIVFFHVTLRESVPISNLCALIASSTRFYTNLEGRHPDLPHKLLVDYEVISITLPMLYLGSLYGVMVGIHLTKWFLSIIMAGTMLAATVVTIRKTIELWNKENEAMEREKENEEENMNLI